MRVGEACAGVASDRASCWGHGQGQGDGVGAWEATTKGVSGIAYYIRINYNQIIIFLKSCGKKSSI